MDCQPLKAPQRMLSTNYTLAHSNAEQQTIGRRALHLRQKTPALSKSWCSWLFMGNISRKCQTLKLPKAKPIMYLFQYRTDSTDGLTDKALPNQYYIRSHISVA